MTPAMTIPLLRENGIGRPRRGGVRFRHMNARYNRRRLRSSLDDMPPHEFGVRYDLQYVLNDLFQKRTG